MARTDGINKKIFNDLSENGFIIHKIITQASKHFKTSITIFYTPEKEEEIAASLKLSGVPIEWQSSTSLTIVSEDLFQRRHIRTALQILETAHFISESFAKEIRENFPGRSNDITPLDDTTFEDEMFKMMIRCSARRGNPVTPTLFRFFRVPQPPLDDRLSNHSFVL